MDCNWTEKHYKKNRYETISIIVLSDIKWTIDFFLWIKNEGKIHGETDRLKCKTLPRLSEHITRCCNLSLMAKSGDREL